MCSPVCGRLQQDGIIGSVGHIGTVWHFNPRFSSRRGPPFNPHAREKCHAGKYVRQTRLARRGVVVYLYIVKCQRDNAEVPVNEVFSAVSAKLGMCLPGSEHSMWSDLVDAKWDGCCRYLLQGDIL